MENLNSVIAVNLKRIREERKLSLDNVAEMTGVSKSMLGQIEREESNPTITTIWKIANGLKISFTTLLNYPQKDTVIVKRQEIAPLIEDNGRYRLYPYFPFEEGRSFEAYTIEIDKGGYLNAEPHNRGAQEFITVFEGELTVKVSDDEFTIGKGDSIRFKADRPHAYHSSGTEVMRASLIIYYSEAGDGK
ncbi:MAG: helix-turn-helix domain-containing protein [Bacillota bacterium]